MAYQPFSLNVLEIDLGTSPLYSGAFTIPGTNLPVGHPVIIVQAAKRCTGKGTLADECEMDMLLVTGVVTNSTTIQAYWTCAPNAGPVLGNLNFSYAIAQ